MARLLLIESALLAIAIAIAFAAPRLGARRNAELVAYFRDRRLWLPQPDVDLPKSSDDNPMAASN